MLMLPHNKLQPYSNVETNTHKESRWDMLDALLLHGSTFSMEVCYRHAGQRFTPNSCTCTACKAAANISVSFVIADQVALTWWACVLLLTAHCIVCGHFSSVHLCCDSHTVIHETSAMIHGAVCWWSKRAVCHVARPA